MLGLHANVAAGRVTRRPLLGVRVAGGGTTGA
jgi:hypothetical protein